MKAYADRYRRLAARFTELVINVPADRWSNPSPCEEWSALDVVRHVVDGQRAIVEQVRGRPPQIPAIDEDPAGAWTSLRYIVQACLDDPEVAGSSCEGPFGPTTFQDVVDRFVCFDLLIHGWDLARATGQDERLDPDEVRRVFLQAQSLGEDLRAPGFCGPALPVAPDADEQTRLLAYLGRRA